MHVASLSSALLQLIIHYLNVKNKGNVHPTTSHKAPKEE